MLAAKEQGELEREAQEVEASIIVLDTDLKAAKAERDRQPVYPSAKEIEEGKASFVAGYKQSQQNRLSKQDETEQARLAQIEIEQETQRLEQEAAQKREQARLDEIKRLQDIEEKKRLQQLQAQAAQRRKEQRASKLQQWMREADAILNQGLETLETELVLAQQGEAKAEAAALAAQAAE